MYKHHCKINSLFLASLRIQKNVCIYIYKIGNFAPRLFIINNINETNFTGVER